MEYENMRMPELKALARDRGLRNYSRMRKTESVALLQTNGTPEDPRAAAPHNRPPPPSRSEGHRAPPPKRRAAYVTLKFDDNGHCRIHCAKRGEACVSDGYEEIVTTEKYVVMPWNMVNVDGKRVSLNKAVDEIFSNKDELTNSTYVILKLDGKGSCKIHSVSDEDGRDPPAHKEIVTNKTYVVMPWKMVTRNGKNITLKEAVKGIEAQRREIEEERMLVSEFETEHSDEIDNMFELIEHLNIEDIMARFPEIYEFGPEPLGIHLESNFVIEGYSSDYQINRGYN